MADVYGLEEILRRLARLASEAPGVVAKAIYQEGLAIQSESMKEVPLDESNLQKTAYTTQPEISADSISSVVGYKGPYAVPQHERLDFVHPNGRKAKYLADPVSRWGRVGASRILKRIKFLTEAK